MEMIHAGQASGKEPMYAELTRRLGFEYGGMVLHEYYFENLSAKGTGEPSKELKEVFELSFGGFDKWKEAFTAVGEMRGGGLGDSLSGSGHGATFKSLGGFALGRRASWFKPILVMDVWEHAFVLDYSPSGRTKYIEAFVANINWNVLNRRLKDSAALRAIG